MLAGLGSAPGGPEGGPTPVCPPAPSGSGDLGVLGPGLAEHASPPLSSHGLLLRTPVIGLRAHPKSRVPRRSVITSAKTVSKKVTFARSGGYNSDRSFGGHYPTHSTGQGVHCPSVVGGGRPHGASSPLLPTACATGGGAPQTRPVRYSRVRR